VQCRTALFATRIVKLNGTLAAENPTSWQQYNIKPFGARIIFFKF
jgi:hypothetical protein